MSRPRTRPTTPAICDCPTVTHQHGDLMMYQRHRCGCDACCATHTAYRARQRTGQRAAAPTPTPASPTAPDLFLATFPFYGGISEARARRIAREQLIELTRLAGVRLIGEPLFRFERAAGGVFLVVKAPAESDRTPAEVRAAAEHFAYEHETAHPRLAAWVTRQLQGVA